MVYPAPLPLAAFGIHSGCWAQTPASVEGDWKQDRAEGKVHGADALFGAHCFYCDHSA